MTVAMAITLIVDVFHRKRTKSDLELVLKNVLIISVRHMVTFLCNTAQPSHLVHHHHTQLWAVWSVRASPRWWKYSLHLTELRTETAPSDWTFSNVMTFLLGIREASTMKNNSVKSLLSTGFFIADNYMSYALGNI